MIATVIGAFVILLLLGCPNAFLVLIATAIGVLLFSNVPPVILIQQIFNGLDNFVLVAVPFFILAGDVASRGGTAKGLVNTMQVFFGRIPGGLGIATVFACAFFGAISGSALATVVAIGTIMIPRLVEAGYPRSMAVGLVTAAGTLGVLIPPSVPMVLTCVAMGTSVGKQFMAGFLPGLLLASVWGIYLYIVCRGRVQTGKRYTLKESLKILWESVPALIFPLIVLGGIYGGVTTPTEAAVVSLFYVLFLETVVFKTIRVREIPRVLGQSAVTAATLSILPACAGVMNWFLTTQQLPAMFSQMIANTISSGWMLILALCAFLFVAGCFMELCALVVILGPMLAPTLAQFNVDPIHFGILAVLCAQVGFLTPPFGLNLFVSMGLTGHTLGEVSRFSLPYTLILMAVTIVVSLWPSFTMFLPNLLLK